MTVVALKDLTKKYATGTLAVDGLTLQVSDGELMVLLGPSGCGKSTTLRLIAGLLQPTRGDVRFDDSSLAGVPPEKRGAVMVFQKHTLFPFMSVGDNVAFGLKLRNLDRTTVGRRVADALATVQLPGFEERWPEELSGGQQQRVALARALAVQPKVLLLDEPFSNLDPGLRDELRAMIYALQRDAGITTIFVTHDQDEAAAIADRIALLFEGRLRQVGPPRAFYTAPQDRQVARFFGGVNFVPGRQSGHEVSTSVGRLHVGPERIADRDVLVTIRPEAIEVGVCDSNNVVGTVQSCGFRGKRLRIQVDVRGQLLEVEASPYLAVQTGEEIALHLPPERICLLSQDDR